MGMKPARLRILANRALGRLRIRGADNRGIPTRIREKRKREKNGGIISDFVKQPHECALP